MDKGSCARRVIPIFLVSTLLACGNGPEARPELRQHVPREDLARTAGSAPPAPDRVIIDRHHRGDRDLLRVRPDRERQRLWVLTLDNVYIYDTRTFELIRRIALPEWFVAEFMCAPDLALDQRGTAFVSNNVQPRLFEISPADFETKEHRLRLISPKSWDIGFGALAFGSDGTLFALSALAGSLFRIDVGTGSAREIALLEPVAGACALTDAGHTSRGQSGAVSLCVALENRTRRVDVSENLAQARVTNAPCGE